MCPFDLVIFLYTLWGTECRRKIWRLFRPMTTITGELLDEEEEYLPVGSQSWTRSGSRTGSRKVSCDISFCCTHTRYHNCWFSVGLWKELTDSPLGPVILIGKRPTLSWILPTNLRIEAWTTLMITITTQNNYEGLEYGLFLHQDTLIGGENQTCGCDLSSTLTSVNLSHFYHRAFCHHRLLCQIMKRSWIITVYLSSSTEEMLLFSAEKGKYSPLNSNKF